MRRVLLRNSARSASKSRAQAGVETIATERVVLCAGAINTPGMLLRSGIGARADVERIGCELDVELPAVAKRYWIIRARRSFCGRGCSPRPAATTR